MCQFEEKQYFRQPEICRPASALLVRQAPVNPQAGSVSMDGALATVRGLLEKARVSELGTEEKDVVTLAHNQTVAEALMVRRRERRPGGPAVDEFGALTSGR